MFILLSKKKLYTAALILLIFLVIIALFFGERVITVNKNSTLAPLDRVNVTKNVIALTINVDWGEEYIPQILEILQENNAKVTFFVTGRWTAKNGLLVKQIAAHGHEIENHGYSPPHPDKLSIESNKQELLKTEKIIEETLYKDKILRTTLWRKRRKWGSSRIGNRLYNGSMDTRHC